MKEKGNCTDMCILKGNCEKVQWTVYVPSMQRWCSVFWRGILTSKVMHLNSTLISSDIVWDRILPSSIEVILVYIISIELTHSQNVGP